MDIIRTLYWADARALHHWLTTKAVSKLIVIALFFLLFGWIAMGLYAIGSVFFRSLASFETYGVLTAQYILHAAIVIIVWLSIGSSVATSVGALFSPSIQMQLLLTLPISKKYLIRWMVLKTCLANAIMLSFAFMPIMFSYASIFQLHSVAFIIQLIIVFLCIVLLSSSIGSAIAIFAIKVANGHTAVVATTSILIFFSALAGLIQLIFPAELSTLYSASSEVFSRVFPALPLNNLGLPTAWLSMTISSGLSVHTLFAMMLTAVVVMISLRIHDDFFIPTLLSERSRSRTTSISRVWEKRIRTSRHPLLIQNWLSIIRLPEEIGYGIFLSSVAIFFFVFIAVGTAGGFRQEAWKTQLILFAFGWVVFFTIAYALRFLYPLMGREGKNMWHIFVMPMTRKSLLVSKIQFAILMTIPPSLFAIFTWSILPFASGYRIILSGISISTIVTIAIVQTLLGAITPDFSKDSSPEKASTSGMGLLALIASTGIALFAGFLTQQFLLSVIPGIVAFLLVSTFGSLIVWVLWTLALPSARRYSL